MGDQVHYYTAKLQYEIDPWDLNEALGRGDKIPLVDTRSPQAYGSSHIPGAVNIPHRTISGATTAHLDKEVLIVTYCDGIRCKWLNQRCAVHGPAWIPRQRVDWRSRLLALRRRPVDGLEAVQADRLLRLFVVEPCQMIFGLVKRRYLGKVGLTRR